MGPLEAALGFFKEGDSVFELEAMLDDVLSHIAFDEFDKDYVAKMKRRLKKFGDFVRSNLSEVGSIYSTSPVLLALYSLENAYLGFMYPCMHWGVATDEERRQEALEILSENFFLDGDSQIHLRCEVNRLERDGYEVTGCIVYSDGGFEVDYKEAD